MASPGRCTAPAASPCRGSPRVQRALEHKLYFDEAYDAIFYRPAAAFATWLRRDFEEPVILTAGPDLGEAASTPAAACSRLQTGLLRTYVFFLGTGMAVLAIVFLLGAMTVSTSRRSSSACRSARRSSSGCCRSRATRPARSRARLAARGRHLDRAVTHFDFGRSGLQFSQRTPWIEDLARLVPRRRVRLLALARRAHRRRDGGRDRLRLLGRPRPAARVLRADALPHRRDRRRLRRAGSAPLLRVLRGDADPALHPRRRVGRPGPARRDGEVPHLHDGRLAPDARRADRLRPEGGHVRPRRRRRRARAAGSSSASCSRS